MIVTSEISQPQLVADLLYGFQGQFHKLLKGNAHFSHSRMIPRFTEAAKCFSLHLLENGFKLDAGKLPV
jgi:hypothetical protein